MNEPSQPTGPAPEPTRQTRCEKCGHQAQHHLGMFAVCPQDPPPKRAVPAAQDERLRPAAKLMTLRGAFAEDSSAIEVNGVLVPAERIAALAQPAAAQEESRALSDEQIDSLMPLATEMGVVFDSVGRSLQCYGFSRDSLRDFARAILAANPSPAAEKKAP